VYPWPIFKPTKGDHFLFLTAFQCESVFDSGLPAILPAGLPMLDYNIGYIILSVLIRECAPAILQFKAT
jgi:hypothetical protein